MQVSEIDDRGTLSLGLDISTLFAETDALEAMARVVEARAESDGAAAAESAEAASSATATSAEGSDSAGGGAR